MKNTCLVVIGLMILITIQACHNDKSKDNVVAKTERHSLLFIKNGMVNGLFEIKASGLAITNSNNHRVIDLAKMIITEQTAIDSGLVSLKSGYHITSADTMLPADSALVDSLSQKTGRTFDNKYINLMVRIHRTDSLLFTLVAASAKPDVKKFAAQSFPAEKKQLDSARAVLSSLK
jgi:putative membrane protein